MGRPDFRAVPDDVMERTRCERNYACLSGGEACRVVPMVDRDLELLRCLGDGPCRHRTSVGAYWVCACPVQRAAHGAPR